MMNATRSATILLALVTVSALAFAGSASAAEPSMYERTTECIDAEVNVPSSTINVGGVQFELGGGNATAVICL